jgi:hypothetical protein
VDDAWCACANACLRFGSVQGIVLWSAMEKARHSDVRHVPLSDDETAVVFELASCICTSVQMGQRAAFGDEDCLLLL